MSLQVGDRIEVVNKMADDPLPPPIGATGTVTEVAPQILNKEDGVHYKAAVRWDGDVVAVGSLLIPQDNLVWRKL